MRRILSALFAFVLLTSTAFANGRDGGRQGSMSLTDTAVGTNVKTGLPMNGLLSYKNAMENDVANPKNLDYSVGSATNTFTVSRDSTHPATYFDGNGVMQVTTTSDVARRTRGYYDATGWHADPGWLLEGASTNLMPRTYPDANWVVSGNNYQYSGTTIWLKGTQVGGVATISMNTSDATFNPVPHISITNGGTNPESIYFCQTSGAGLVSLTNGTTYTLSFFIKDSASTTYSSSRVIYLQEGDDDLTAYKTVSTSITTVANKWVRLSFTFVFDYGSDVTDARVVLALGNKGAHEIDWTCFQLEQSAYPSSYIPTNSAALTRNAETINTYTTAGNFPAPSGGNCLSFDGQNASGDDYVSIPNSATGNQVYGSTAYSVEVWGFIRSDGEGDIGRIINKVGNPNSNALITQSQSGNSVAIRYAIDSASSLSYSTSTVVCSLNAWHHIVGTYDNTSKVSKVYIDGTEVSYSARQTGIGDPGNDSGNVFCIGNKTDTSSTGDSFIQCVRIYRNKELTSGDVANLYNAGRGQCISNISAVSGCTAEYLFNEGTGSTLTDTIAANNGTISGATWSKDTHAGSIMLRYRPVMLPSEQDASYKNLMSVQTSTGNVRAIIYNSNANNNLSFAVQSNSNGYSPSTLALTSWTRYQSHAIIGTWSTTADSNGYKVVLYVDGVQSGTPNQNFAVPAGYLPATWSIQPTAGQAMILEEMAVWDHPLTQAEVTQIQNRS